MATAITNNPSAQCPQPILVPETNNATLAEAVYQYISSVPVEANCCQHAGVNCGGRFIDDVKFLWAWVPARDADVRQSWNTTYNVRFQTRK